MDLDLWDCFGRANLILTHTIAKFHRTDFDICNHSRKGKTLFYSRVNRWMDDLRFYILFNSISVISSMGQVNAVSGPTSNISNVLFGFLT